MAERSLSMERGRSSPADFDDRMWPVNLAVFILAGFLIGIVQANGDFEEPRLLLNGYAHMAVVVAAAVILCLAASLVKNTIRRRLQLCILLSLLLHLSLAVFVYCHPMQLPMLSEPGGAGSGSAEPDDEVVAPDYHWAQAEEAEAPQTFETPVTAAVQQESPVAEAAESRDAARPVPVAEVPRPTPGEITPLGTGGAGGLLEMHRAASKQDEKPEPFGLAAMLARRAASVPDLPKAEAEIPAPTPETPKPAKEIQPATVASEKPALPLAAMKGGPAAAAKSITPRPVVRMGPESSGALAARGVAPLPLELARRDAVPGEPSGPAALNQSDAIARTDRAEQNLPSSAAGDVEPAAAAPAGRPAASRIEATSSTPVERSPVAHAPWGQEIGAAGTHALGIGSSLIASRSGSPDGHGTARPSASGQSDSDDAALRRGAAGSFLQNGAPLPVAAARRGTASQPRDAGEGLAPSLSATLPRTRAADGLDLPAATAPVEPAATAGAGGTGPGSGGVSGYLEVGPTTAVGRSYGPFMPDRRTAADTGSPVGGVARPGPMAIGGRGAGVDLPAPAAANVVQADVPRTDIGRAAMGPDLPAATAESGDAQRSSLPTAAIKGPPLDASVGRGLDAADFSGAARGAAEPQRTGRRAGSSPASGVDLTDLPGASVQGSPQPSGIAGRHGGDGELAFLSSSSGPGRLPGRRTSSEPAVEGAVREPTEFYRRRAALRQSYGFGEGTGSGFTEPAVENGLDFFTHMQFPDGHWSLDKLPEGVKADSAALGEMQADSAATGLAMLAYLGAGYTHLDEKHRDVVRRGIEWLVKHQKPDGDLFTGGSPAARLYSHGIAAMALCELYGMTQDPELREPAQRAINYIVATQDPRRGGWRYVPREGTDTSVTGWQLMALKSGQMAGLDVPEETFRKIGGWLDKAMGPADDGTYIYNPWNLDNEEEREGRLPSPTMTAEAMLMRMYLGQKRNSGQLIKGAEYLKTHLPEVGTLDQPSRDCYYWYYATQAMYQMQGDYWKTWNSYAGPLVKAGQVKEGDFKGSWHPMKPVPDRWGGKAGRVYVTAMHLLMLEVYYRHLPLFQELSK